MRRVLFVLNGALRTVAVLLFAFVKLFGWIGKRNRDPKYQDKHGTFLNKFLYGFYIMVHPFDGFWDLKHEKRGSAKAGTFDSLWIAEEIKDNVVEEDLWICSGDAVGDFSGANEAIGTLVLRFESQERLVEVLENQEKYVKVCLK